MNEGDLCIIFGTPADPRSITCQSCLMNCKFAGYKKSEEVIIPDKTEYIEGLMRK